MQIEIRVTIIRWFHPSPSLKQPHLTMANGIINSLLAQCVRECVTLSARTFRLSQMKRVLPKRKWLALACGACLFWTSNSIASDDDLPERTNQQVESSQPNIILLIADDLGYGECSWLIRDGREHPNAIPMPHLDELASQSIRFHSAYVTASYCSSSRAGLFTGKIQNRFGYEFNPIGADNEDPLAGLPANQRTLARALHDEGYVTGLIGKWHLGGTARNHPHRRGFDEFFGFLHEGHYFVPPPYDDTLTMIRRRTLPGGGEGRLTSGSRIYTTHMGHDEPAYDANNPILRGGQPVEEEEYLTDAFTREAIDFIERHHEHPFFLTLAYNAVHSPLQARLDDLERVSQFEDVHRRIFAAMSISLDDSIGELVDTIDSLGIRENTLIVFLSDNGGPTRELTSSNAPLRGEKGSLYEGGVRVPLLVSLPETVDARDEESPVSSLDIFATVMELAHVETEMMDLDGQSLVPLFPQRPSLPVPVTPKADRSDRWDEAREFYWRMNRRVAFRKGDWKLVGRQLNDGSLRWELYDLATDLSEQRDLAEHQPDRLSDLESRWLRWNEEMIDPIWQRSR